MTYQFYITDEIPHGDSVYAKKPTRDFLPFEKFLLNNSTNKKTVNSAYSQVDAEKVVKEIKSNDESLKEQYHNDRCDTAHEYYDYVYARQNADDGYGPIEAQIEHISEKGITSWKNYVSQVKDRYPKP